jgi:hypothetical protein
MSELLEGWSEPKLLGRLPRPVRDSISALEEQSLQWDEAGSLMAMSPAIGILTKGGGRWPSTLWQGVKEEFYSFPCTESTTYTDLRR